MTLYTFLHALAVGSLWTIGGVVVLLCAAIAWGWMMKRDPAEFWDRRRMDTEATYQHAPQHNRYTDSHLQIVKDGCYPDEQPFGLDFYPAVTDDSPAPAA